MFTFSTNGNMELAGTGSACLPIQPAAPTRNYFTSWGINLTSSERGGCPENNIEESETESIIIIIIITNYC